MYATIKRLYAKTQDKTLVENAVKRGWITAEQYEEITGEAYEEIVGAEVAADG